LIEFCFEMITTGESVTRTIPELDEGENRVPLDSGAIEEPLRAKIDAAIKKGSFDLRHVAMGQTDGFITELTRDENTVPLDSGAIEEPLRAKIGVLIKKGSFDLRTMGQTDELITEQLMVDTGRHHSADDDYNQSDGEEQQSREKKENEEKEVESGLVVHSNIIQVNMKLSFNPDMCGKDVELINTHRVRVKKGCIGMALSTCKFGTEQQRECRWRVQLHSIGDFSWIGFVDANATNWNLNGCLIRTNQWSVGFRSGFDHMDAYINGTRHDNVVKVEGERMKNGDVVEFVINFEEKTCKIFHNKLDLGVVFRDIPNLIIPAVSNADGGEHGDFEFV